MKTFIFDFDGTIADVITSQQYIVNVLAKDLGLREFSPNQIKNLRSKTLPQIMKEFKVSWLKFPYIIKRIKELSYETRDKLLPIEGIQMVLLALKESGNKLGILTSNTKENVSYFLQKCDLEVFDFIVSDSSIFGKEHKIRRILREKKLRSEEVFYVGDEVRDIEACKKCKVRCISVSWGLNSKEILEKNTNYKVITHPEELLNI